MVVYVIISYTHCFDVSIDFVDQSAVRGVPAARAAVQHVASVRLRRAPRLVLLQLQDVPVVGAYVLVPRVLPRLRPHGPRHADVSGARRVQRTRLVSTVVLSLNLT